MTSGSVEPVTFSPSDDPVACLDLSRFLEQHSEPAVLLGPDGQQVRLTEEIYAVLKQVVAAMELKQAVSIVPIDQRLTTQQAADFLGISRPTFVKILERGDVPFEVPSGGRHRRVLLRDLVRYQQRTRQERTCGVQELIRSGYEQGLHGVPLDEVDQALTAVKEQQS